MKQRQGLAKLPYNYPPPTPLLNLGVFPARLLASYSAAISVNGTCSSQVAPVYFEQNDHAPQLC